MRVYGTAPRARREPCPGIGMAARTVPLPGDVMIPCPFCERMAPYRKSDGTIGVHTVTPRVRARMARAKGVP